MGTLWLPQTPSWSPAELAADPARRRSMQQGRPGFLFSGSVQIDDGFVTDENGLTTTYALIRPLVFEDYDDPSPNTHGHIQPGDFGLRRLNFPLGRVGIRYLESSVLLLTGSPSHQFLDGRITIVHTSSLGSLADFAIWPTGQEDPRQFYVETATDLDGGGVSQPYVRHSAVFVPHRRARYLGVGARLLNVPNTGARRNQYFKKWMVEKAPVSDPTPTGRYRKAREIEVRLTADRINYYPNPSFEVDVDDHLAANANTTIDRVTAATAHSGGSVLRLTAVGAGDLEARGENTSVPVAPGWPLSVGFAVRAAANTPRVVQAWFQFYDSNETYLGNSQVATVTEVQNVWVPVVINNVIPLEGTATASLAWRVVGAAGAGEEHFIDSVLVERERVAGTYFDGSFSADTIWEKGGTPGKCRSHLYKNRAARAAAIDRVLEDNVPLGIGIARPVFGLLPVESGVQPPTSSTTLYGSGNYGDGFYGG
jgi:hypothetical protein